MGADICNKNEKKYISDVIGNGYKEWGREDTIFLTATTGAGKSQFILHDFLEWQIQQGFNILYLVNRKILKKQIEKDLKARGSDIYAKYGVNYNNYITITTYHSLEKGIKGKRPCDTINWMHRFWCVVCDECHYFYTDSNFNTETVLSYLTIREVFDTKLQIYISATADKIKKDIKKYINEHTMKANPNSEQLQFKERKPMIEYTLMGDYDHVEPLIVHDDEELIEIVMENVKQKKEKWLIFVDNIKKGKDIKNKIIKDKDIDKSIVVFLDADYEKNEEAEKSVKDIIENKSSKKQIVISTAVMDNGITFQDEKLVNIVIFSDIKETFIQMMGRRRGSEKALRLYICKRDSKHFQQRLQNVEKIIESFLKNKGALDNLHESYVLQYNGNSDLMNYIQCLDKINYFLNNNYTFYQIKSPNAYCQQEILEEMLSNTIDAQSISKYCYSINGFIDYNDFSINRCLDLKNYYKEMIKKLEKDENAFVYQQMEWLGIRKDVIEAALEDADKELDIRCRDILDRSLKKLIEENGEVISKEAFYKWKVDNKKEIWFFLQTYEGINKNEEKYLEQNDRNLDEKKFNYCMEKAKLDYQVFTQKENTKIVGFRIEKSINH